MTNRQITDMMREIAPRYQEKADARAKAAEMKKEERFMKRNTGRYAAAAACSAAAIVGAFLLFRMMPKQADRYTYPSAGTTAAVQQESTAAAEPETTAEQTEAFSETQTAAQTETEAAAGTIVTYPPSFDKIDLAEISSYFAPVYALGTDVSAYQQGDIDMNGKVDPRDVSVCSAVQSWIIIARTEAFQKLHPDCRECYLTDDQIALGDVNKDRSDENYADFQPVNSGDGAVISEYLYYNDYLHEPTTMEQAAVKLDKRLKELQATWKPGDPEREGAAQMWKAQYPYEKEFTQLIFKDIPANQTES